MLSLDMPNHSMKDQSLVIKGIVWAEFKMLVDMVVIMSFGPGSSAGKVGVHESCVTASLNSHQCQ